MVNDGSQCHSDLFFPPSSHVFAKVLGPEGDVQRGSSLINASEVSVPWIILGSYGNAQQMSIDFVDVP